MQAATLESIKPGDLPVPPEAAFQVIRACSEEGTDAGTLGALIACDPVLTTELLRVANSAYFGFASEISSVTRATAAIGLRSLRNIVLCVALRDTLRPDQLPALPINDFWEDALRRAVCARALASVCDIDPDTCFTAGLLLDFGLLVLFHLQPGRISEWPQLKTLTPDERLELEQQLFGTTHEAVGGILSASWMLPPELAHALGNHHAPVTALDPDAAVDLAAQICRVASAADWMAAVVTADDSRAAIDGCRARLAGGFGLDAHRADEMLGRIAEEITLAAQSLGFEVGAQPDYESVIREASLRLAEDNLGFQEIISRLEDTLAERDRVARELKQELDMAREVQRSLLPADGGRQLRAVGLNVSARAVSGDFYDAYTLPDGRITFCIADVAGKGMHAALLMAKTSSLFHCLGKSVHDPGKLLMMINREIVERTIHGMFVTMVAGIFDPESGEVVMANAGHLPVIRMAGREPVTEYAALAPPLGIVADAQFPCETFNLERDSLLMVTDGVLEARIGKNRRLERDGLLRLLVKHAGKAPVERLQHIVGDVRQKAAEIEDDMTLLLIESFA